MVFTLMTERGDKDNFFIFARKESTEEILSRWRTGVEVMKGSVAKMEGEPVVEANRIFAEFIPEDDPRKRILGEARCGEFGYCVSNFVMTNDKQSEELKKVLIDFGNSIHFVEPGVEHLYDNFKWEYYLKGKYIFSFQSNQMYKKENNVWLCSDGTFTSKLKRSGMIKGEIGSYKGNKSGTYTISGMGDTGTLTLNFKKLPPVDVELQIRDDKIYINGIQHFVSNHSCN
jgi:hypothetical protein